MHSLSRGGGERTVALDLRLIKRLSGAWRWSLSMQMSFQWENQMDKLGYDYVLSFWDDDNFDG